MNAFTTLSAKGQVVIPKDVRDSLDLKPGQKLEVIQTGGGVLLRAATPRSERTFEEITASIRAITAKYRGPPVSIDDMNETINEEYAKRALRRS
ncbi:AbrB/MazE/SpoVT family DNA-binding domain-containing protein [Sphingomonas sp. Y38-1Y]|uniref:AbrB/MazE/SpoVT family DNA-binding domain-containing protein n=1 Tax=Sphingomonas sp. Y38-1Y TaxID=3078265 RepID=UPI0028EDB11A|nr:AbrB/MazE/SpoVT family DNA-binding domain-containing protein [Sphingomonas sp. Y38-1Y]